MNSKLRQHSSCNGTNRHRNDFGTYWSPISIRENRKSKLY